MMKLGKFLIVAVWIVANLAIWFTLHQPISLFAAGIMIGITICMADDLLHEIKDELRR